MIKLIDYTYCIEINLLLKMVKKDVLLKTWKKFRKPGENFQKTFGHPENIKKRFKYFTEE